MKKGGDSPAANRFRLAIFDLDGTLLDTAEGIVSSVCYTTDAFSLPRVSASAIRTFIGPPIQQSFARYYGVDADRAGEMAAVFRGHYMEEDLLKATPYDGIFDLLGGLRSRGVRLAVATYKREDYAETLLCRFGFDRYIPIRRGADLAGKLTKADIIRRCIAESGVPQESAVMIGDAQSDADGAAGAGIPLIGVTYGFGFSGAEDVRAAGGLPSASPLRILDYFPAL